MLGVLLPKLKQMQKINFQHVAMWDMTIGTVLISLEDKNTSNDAFSQTCF